MFHTLAFFMILMLGCVNFVTADYGDNIANNLASDLGPLLSLFGERVTMQFMSQAMGLADCVLLAMAPIGIITIVVSAIRVGGPVWLKALVGRARENLSAAEIELMSSTSTETCELWNGQNVVRCHGSANIYQFICLVPKSRNPKSSPPPCPTLEFLKLDDALESGLIKQTDATSLSYAWNRLKCHPDGLRNRLGVFLENCRKHISFSQCYISQRRTYGQNNLPNPDSSADDFRGNDLECAIQQNGITLNENTNRAPPKIAAHISQQPTSTLANTEIKNPDREEKDQPDEPAEGEQHIVIIRDMDDCAPNISLNCHNRINRGEIYIAAVIGIFLQFGVLAFAGVITFYRTIHFSYAFPCVTIGTTLVTLGTFLCVIVVEQSTKKTFYKAQNGMETWVVWLQKSHTVNDQEFKPFAIYPTSNRKLLITSRRRNGQESKSQNQSSVTKGNLVEEKATSLGLEAITIIAAGISIIGFITQFIGLRGYPWSTPVAYLGATITMTILRAWVGRYLAEPPAQKPLTPNFELDWLAASLENSTETPWERYKRRNGQGQPKRKIDRPSDQDDFQWAVRTGGPWEHQLMNTADARCAKLSAAQKVLTIREKLGHITNWQGPSTKEAIDLSLAIEAAADTLLSSSSEKKLSWAIPITYIASDEYVFVELTKHAKGWKVKIEDVDALLSLWLYSSVLPYSSRRHNTGNARFNRGQEPGLRLCGPSQLKETLLRDLQQWIPEYAPEIFTLRFLPDGDASAETVLKQQIVGFGMQYSMNTGSATKPIHYRYMSPDNSQETNNATESRDGGGHSGNYATEDSLLAVKCHDAQGKLFSRDLLFSFIRAVAKRLDVATLEVSIENLAAYDSIYWKEYKFANGTISKLVQKLEKYGFGTLSDVYFDVIAPLSIENKLSDISNLLDEAQGKAANYLSSCQWYDLGQVCRWIFDLAMQINPESSDYPRAIAICLEYMCRIFHEDLLERNETRLGNELRHLIRDFQDQLNHERFTSSMAAHFSRLIYLRGDLWHNECLDSSLPRGMTTSFEERDIFPANFGITQAHLAAIKGELAEVEDTWEIHQRDAFDWTPLHYAALKCPNFSFTSNALPYLRSENIMRWTPLHYACLEGNESMVECLMGLQFPSPVDFTGFDGVTPLHCAAKNGNIKVVSWLLSPPTERYGAYSDRVFREREARDYNERCPIHWAIVAGHIGVVELLKTDVSLEDRFGWTSLHLAAVYGHHEMVDFISGQLGVNINKLDRSSRTPLHLAIEHGSAETVRELLKAGANVNITSVNGTTPLHVALGAKGGSRSKLDGVIEILLAASADPNAACLDGTTPLHLAAEHGANSTVRMLLEVGANVNATSQDGTTPLHRAAINSNAREEIMQTLIKHGANANQTNFRGETPQDIVAKHDVLKREALGDYEIQLRLLKQQNDLRRNATSHKTESK